MTGGQDNLPWTEANGWITAVAKPALKLSSPGAQWASYADYVTRSLSVNLSIANTGSGKAFAVQLTGNANTNGVTLETALPATVGDIAAGSSASVTLRYQVPVGVGSWRSIMTASARDAAGAFYSYP